VQGGRQRMLDRRTENCAAYGHVRMIIAYR
jgi:hypothetical protein